MGEGLNTVLLALNMKEGATSQGLWAEQPQEAGRVKETGCPLEPPEGMQPCHHLDFSPVRPVLDF